MLRAIVITIMSMVAYSVGFAMAYSTGSTVGAIGGLSALLFMVLIVVADGFGQSRRSAKNMALVLEQVQSYVQRLDRRFADLEIYQIWIIRALGSTATEPVGVDAPEPDRSP